jgi:hypothetical protein
MKRVCQTVILGILAGACSKAPKPAGAQAHQGMVMVPDTTETELRATRPDPTGLLLMMQAHIDSLARMSPEQMKGALPEHQRLTSRLLEETAASGALAVSIRQDLADLAKRRGPALSNRMQAHLSRLRQLVAMQKKTRLQM